MSLQPRILHKGLALVLIPLILETLWLLLLSQLWLSTEYLAVEETKQRDFAMHLAGASEDRHVVILELMSRMFDPKIAWAIYANRKHNALHKHYEQLRELSANDPARLETISELERMSETEWKSLIALPSAQPGSTMLDNLGACRDLGPLLRLGISDGEKIGTLMQAEMNGLAATRAREQSARNRVKFLVYAGLSSNFALAALLLYLFNSNITGRLQLLIDNARRLPLREKLTKVVSGSDELAYLDTVMHAANEQLCQSDDHRRSIMEMVAHDMRSPLMAAQVSTEVLNHPQSAKLPTAAAHILESVSQYVNQVLRLVNELLTIERFEAGKVDFSVSEFNIKEAVDEAILTYREVGDLTEFSIKNTCPDRLIRADKEKFEQLLINYFASVKAFPGSEPEISVFAETTEDGVRVLVKVPGPPLDRSVRTDLFRKFPKHGNKSTAAGLSLVTCQLIAQSHGGAVGFEQNDGFNSLWVRMPSAAIPEATVPVISGTKYSPKSFNQYKPKGWFGARIIHKGIALVIIPLCLEALWIGWLNHELQIGEAQATTIQRLTDTLLNVNAGLNATFDVTVNAASYALSGNPKWKEQAKAQGDVARSVQARLKEQTSGYPAEARLVDLFEFAMIKPMNLQLQITERPHLGLMGSASIFQVFIDYSKAMSYVAATYDDLFAKEKAELERLRAEQTQSKQSLQRIVLAWLATNFILALILVLAFNIHITKRLNILVANAKKLPRREPLLEELSGGDELVYLDKILHRGAEEVIEAARQRQAIVELLVDDMRSPLTSARDSLSQVEPLLLDKMPDTAPRHILAIKGNIERILQLVDDLLTLESAEENKLTIRVEPFEVREAVDEALAALASIAKYRQIQMLNESEGFELAADRSRVLQVLLNYLSNAIKFSPPHTQISVVTEHDGDTFKIGVRDQGPGMDAKSQEQLFERFYQTKASDKARGFGLGLAICKLIAESHGGTVSVVSELGHGSTFWLSLPIHS